MKYENTREHAKGQDLNDPLSGYRDEFYIPEKEGASVVYLCGNSLGLQPKSCEKILLEDLNAWKNMGVEGHFEGNRPWLHYHKAFTEPLAQIVGAKASEVVAMNSLTVNIHLLLASFYRPEGKRTKILMESLAFSSDIYAIRSFVTHLGLDPEETIINLEPGNGELYDTNDIIEVINNHNDTLALVLLGGLNYYTGQVFDMEAITAAAHAVGAKAGFDLAHAAGNISMRLHDWKVDFAAWCSYKYLNGGPGAVSGVYIHEQYAKDPEHPRLAGWWGQEESSRFQMNSHFEPTKTAEGWMVSNSSVFNMSNLLASLQLFEAAGMENLRKKSVKLTGYLAYLIKKADPESVYIKMITPQEIEQRGCQLSMYVPLKSEELFSVLTKKGVILDWRRPDVIRVAPTPLYNSFEDVYNFYERLVQSMNEVYG